MLGSVALGLLKWNDCLQDIIARIEESQVLAGCRDRTRCPEVEVGNSAARRMGQPSGCIANANNRPRAVIAATRRAGTCGNRAPAFLPDEHRSRRQ